MSVASLFRIFFTRSPWPQPLASASLSVRLGGHAENIGLSELVHIFPHSGCHSQGYVLSSQNHSGVDLGTEMGNFLAHVFFPCLLTCWTKDVKLHGRTNLLHFHPVQEKADIMFPFTCCQAPLQGGTLFTRW